MASHPLAPGESSSSNPPDSPPAPGWQGIASDWASDREVFKQVPWGKAMMWIFLLSDTFIFTCFFSRLHVGTHDHHHCLAEPQ